MARSTQSALRELVAQLELAGPAQALRDLLPRMRVLLALDAMLFAVPVERASGWTLEGVELDGFANPTRARRLLVEHFARSSDPLPWLDLRFPPEGERNRAVDPIAAIGRATYTASALHAGVVVPLGLSEHHVVRVLLCEDALVLGWLVGFSLHAIERASFSALETLARALQQRLRVERLRDAAPHVHAALSATLEQIGAPALVIDSTGRVFQANQAARALLDERRDEVWASLSAAIGKQRASIPFALTPIDTRDDAKRFLAVLRPRSTEARLALAINVAAHRWKLTKRQTQVLHLLMRGDSNAAIARELGITDRAAELHISALFDRARVSNRAALVASVLLGS